MTKKILAALLAASVLTMAPVVAGTSTLPREFITQTIHAADSVSNLDYATAVSASDKSWTEGCYYVSAGSSVTINGRVTVTGNVNLILEDGCTLTVNGGIYVAESASFTIYGQEKNSGKLVIDQVESNHAGIGGGYVGYGGTEGKAGDITINGGDITVKGGWNAAGIGSGGSYSSCGNIVINGGTVMAEGGSNGAGIGSGVNNSQCGTITINGGTVTATGGTKAAGIGAGNSSSTCGMVTINGGVVKAYSGEPSASYTPEQSGSGIGKGYGSFSVAFQTSSTGNAVIYAIARGDKPGISDNDDTLQWNGIFFLNSEKNATVYGKVTLPGDYTVDQDEVLTIPSGAVLIIPQGKTLTVNGKIINNGKIIHLGQIINNGEITGSGGISDSEFIEPDPEQPDIEEPAEGEGKSETYIPSTPISDGFHTYSIGTMYYQDGKRTRGWADIDGARYYFDEKGIMATGWKEIEPESGDWYHFGEDGALDYGWYKEGNVWYYLDPVTGLMYNDGLAAIDKSTYYFYDWGGMASDWWYEAEDGWYFFGGSGAMKAAQWLEWKGDWYYLTETGKMAADTSIGGYYVGASGVWVK